MFGNSLKNSTKRRYVTYAAVLLIVASVVFIISSYYVTPETKKPDMIIEYQKTPDPNFDVVIRDSAMSGPNLVVEFYHNSSVRQKVWINGNISYKLSTDFADKNEIVTLTVYNWKNDYFELHVGEKSAILKFGKKARVLERRTANSDIYDNGDGTKTATIYSYPANMRDKNGTYRPFRDVVELQPKTADVLELRGANSIVNIQFIGLNPSGRAMPINSIAGFGTRVENRTDGYKFSYDLRLPNTNFKVLMNITSDMDMALSDGDINVDDMKISFKDVLAYGYRFTTRQVNSRNVEYEITKDFTVANTKAGDAISIDPFITTANPSQDLTLADAQIFADNGILIKFPLSSIPAGSVIGNAKLYMNKTTNGGEFTSYAVLIYNCSGASSSSNVTGQNWTESSLPADLMRAFQDKCTYTGNKTTVTTTNGMYSWDVTTSLRADFSTYNRKNSTFLLNATAMTTAATWVTIDGDALTTGDANLGNDYNIDFLSRSGTGQNQPYLNVTYYNAPMNVTFSNPTDANNAVVSRNYTYINITPDTPNTIWNVKLSWNYTNMSIYEIWMVFASNFNNNTDDWGLWGQDAVIQKSLGGWPNCSLGVPGRFGGGCSFNGTGWLNATWSGVLNLSKKNFTVEAWVYVKNNKTSDVFGLSTVIAHQWNTNAVWGMFLENRTLKPEFWINNRTTTTLVIGTGITQNAWYHLAGVFNGTHVVIYVNGALSNSVACTNCGTYPTGEYSDLLIGGYNGWDWGMNGTIDEMRIYWRALSPQEINVSYNSELGRYYANITELANGSYSYYAMANDSGGFYNFSETRTIIIGGDITPPTISIQSPTNRTYGSKNITLNYTAGDETALSFCKYSLNDASNVTMPSVCENGTFLASEGWNKLYVFVNDTNNNYASASVNFTTDSLINGALQQPTNTTYASKNITFNFTVSQNPNGCIYELNGVNTSISCRNGTFLGAEGSNQFLVWFNNTANVTNATTRVKFTINSMINGALQQPTNTTYNSLNTTFNFTVSQNPNACRYELNSVNTTISCLNGTFLGVEGSNQFLVWFNNTANVTNATSRIKFTIDTTKPLITIQSPLNTTNSSATVRLNYTAGDEKGVSQCWYTNNGGAGTALANCINTTFTGAEGVNRLLVWINDTANNTQSASVNFTIDTTKPTVAIQSPLNTTNNTVTVWLNYTAGDVGAIQCWYTNNAGVGVALTNCINTTFTGAEGTNRLLVWVNDTANNTQTASVNFTINSLINGALQQPTNTTYSSNNITFNFTVSQNPDSCTYELDGVNTTTPNCINGTFNVNSQGSHQFLVWFNNTANVTNATSRVWFTFDNVSIATIIQAPTNTTYTNSNITFNYTVSENPTGCIYELNGVNSTILNCQNGTFIATQGNNNFLIWTNDTANNTNASARVWFTMDNISIAMALQNPQNTTYNNRNITFNYTVNENPTACWYELDGANSTEINQCRNGTFNVNSQGSHQFLVWNNDTANNTNATPRVWFTFDNISIAISVQNPQNTTYNNLIIGGNITFNFTVSENPTSCRYELNGANTTISCKNGTFIAQQDSNQFLIWINDTANNWNASERVFFTYDNTTLAIRFVFPTPLNETINRDYAYINVTLTEVPDWIRLEWNGTNETMSGSGASWYKNKTTLDNGNYTFRVYANDTAGNMNVSETRWVIIRGDRLPPNITLSSPANTTYDYMNISLNFDARDDFAVDSCWYKLNGGTNTTISGCQNISIMFNEGFNQLDVYLNDSAGRVNSSSVNFTTQFSANYPEYLPRSSSAQTLYNASYRIAMRFYANSGSNGFNASFYGRRVGTIEGMIAELYSDSSDNLGSRLETATNRTPLSTTVGWQANFTFTTALTAGSWYWIKFYPNKTGNSTSTYYQLYYLSPRLSGAYVKYSADNWTTVSELGQSILWISNKTINTSVYPYQVLATQNIYGSTAACQKYTPSADMKVNQTFLYLGNRYSDPGPVDVLIKSGSCDGSTIASSSLSKANARGLFFWLPLALNDTVVLRRNTPVYISVSSPASNAVNYWQVGYITTNPRQNSFNSDTDFAKIGVTNYPDRDLVFGLDNFRVSPDIKNFMYGSYSAISISGVTWQTIRFKPTTDGTLRNIALYLRMTAGTANLSVCLRSDSSDAPSTVLECRSTNTTSGWGLVNISGFTSSLTANTAYWMSLNTSTGTTYQTASLAQSASDTYVKSSSNSGSTWGTTSSDAPIIINTTSEILKNNIIEVVASSIYSTNNMSQSFVPTSNATFTGVLLLISKDYRDIRNMTVELRTDNSGIPGSAVLRTASVAFNRTTNYYGAYKAQFNDSINLTSGTRYHIILAEPDVSPNTFYWLRNRYEPNTDGFQNVQSRYCYKSGASWTCSDNYDFEFALLTPNEIPANDTAPPTIIISYPSDGQNINSSMINITFIAADDSASLLTCRLYVNGRLNQTNSSTASGTTTKFSVRFADGVHSAYVLCLDSNNNMGTSSSVNFRIDTVKPIGSILSPRNGAAVNGNVTILATASDSGSGIKNVTFQWTNKTNSWTYFGASSVSLYTAMLDTGIFPTNSNVTVRIIAYDNAGNANSTIRNVTLKIDHLAPIIQNITVEYPSGQSQVRDGQNVTLRLNASDSSGAGMAYVSVNLTDLNTTSYANMTLNGGMLGQTGVWTGWNITVDVYASISGLVLVEIIAFDNATPTSNNADGQFFVVEVDNQAPQYSDVSTVMDNATGTIYHSVYWSDNYNISYYVFSSNYTGDWVNESYEIGMNETWINISMIMPQPGSYGWIMYANDSVGNINDTGLQMVDIIDAVPPVVIITSPQGIMYNISTIELIYSVTDNFGVDQCWYSLNSGDTNVSLTNCQWINITFPEDSNTITVYANDTSGNMGSASVTFMVASQIVITIYSPINTTYGMINNISLNYVVYGGAIDSCWYVLNNGSAMALPDCANITFLGNEGFNNLTVYANNTLGFTNSTSVNFTIDTTPPAFAIQSPENKSYAVTNISLNYTVNADVAACQYSLNDGTNITLPGCANTTFLATANQQNKITLYANDTAGNINSSTVRFTVDTIAPQINLTLPENITYITGTISINYTVSDNLALDSCWYSLDNRANILLQNCANTTIAVADSALHKLIVYVNDTANNVNSSGVNFTVRTTAFPVYSVTFRMDFNISGTPGDVGYVSTNTASGTYMKENLDHYYTCVQDPTITGTPAFGIVHTGQNFYYITMTQPNNYIIGLSQYEPGNEFAIPVVSGCSAIMSKMLQIESGQALTRFTSFAPDKKYPTEITTEYPFEITGSDELRGNVELVLERTETGITIRKK